ncbi:MAG: hypothetical protein ACE5JS_14885, partial [Nitrospinota bacterium]
MKGAPPHPPAKLLTARHCMAGPALGWVWGWLDRWSVAYWWLLPLAGCPSAYGSRSIRPTSQ